MNQTIEYHRSVALANDGAMTFGSPHVCTEHLLLGLAAESKGAAAKTLKSFGVGVKEISSELKKLIGIEMEKDREKLPSGGRFIVPQKET